MLRQLIEKRWEYVKNILISFIDINKAYNMVQREKIWTSLIKRYLVRDNTNNKKHRPTKNVIIV